MITIQLNNQLINPSLLTFDAATNFTVGDDGDLIALNATDELCVVAAGQWVYATKS